MTDDSSLRGLLHEMMPPASRPKLRELFRGDDREGRAMRRLLDCLDRDGDDLLIQWEAWRQVMVASFHAEGLMLEGELVGPD